MKDSRLQMTIVERAPLGTERCFFWILLVVSAGGIATSYLPKVMGQPWLVWWHTLITQFSYFTMLSNLAVLLLSVGQLFFPRRRWALALASMTGQTAIAVYVSLTCLVYHGLLATYHSPRGLAQLSNYLTHTITPLLYVSFWWLCARGQPLALQRVWLMLAFPVLFLLYWLVRGPMVGSYPYFFIDVNTYGYLQVLLHGVALCLAFWLLGFAFWALSANSTAAMAKLVESSPEGYSRTSGILPDKAPGRAIAETLVLSKIDDLAEKTNE